MPRGEARLLATWPTEPSCRAHRPSPEAQAAGATWAPVELWPLQLLWGHSGVQDESSLQEAASHTQLSRPALCLAGLHVSPLEREDSRPSGLRQ